MTNLDPQTLSRKVHEALEELADSGRAPGMQAYMKSAMPYLGIAADPLRRAVRPIFANLRFATASEWGDAVLHLWRGARYREERHAAIELTRIPAARRFQRADALPLYEELIVTGAWWDFVDILAGNRLWKLLVEDRAPMTAAMREWAGSTNLWKRRSAIICQLPARADTDLDLLYTAIEGAVGSHEFFLRKAIGWALRQYARTDPREVVRYVRANEARLSPLSRREALKRVPLELLA